MPVLSDGHGHVIICPKQLNRLSEHGDDGGQVDLSISIDVLFSSFRVCQQIL